jgi:hypothetical protein
MRRTLLFLTILFFLFALTSPHRFAYAAAPQTDPLAAARDAIESVVQSLTPPPLASQPQPNLGLRSAPNAANAQAPSVFVAASQSALHTLAYALSQAASAWSTWVALANARLIAKVKVASIPASAAVIVAQTGANAPPIASTSHSALPTPHLFPLAGASSRQSNRTYATANVGVVLGTSTQVSYVTQDELTAQLTEAANALRSLIYQNDSAPGSVYATGGYMNDIALSNRIDNLSGSSNGPLTISDASFNNVSGLIASEIPPLNYFPASSTIAIAYGGTGTSTAPSANELLLSDANGNWEYVATSSLGITSGISSQWTTTGSTVSYAGGSVVIGTTTANHEFDVWGISNTMIGTTTGDPTLTVTNAGQTLGNGSSVAFQGVDTNGTEVTLARISDISTSLTAGAASGNLAFFTRNAGTQQQDLTILAAGNVGIGTTTPLDALDINGSEAVGSYAGSNTAPSDGLIVSGNVGIGTPAPTSTLSVNGSFSIGATSSLATLGSETVSDGTFTSNPSGTWTLGTNWSWDSTNNRASYSGSGGPIAVLAINDGGSGYSSGDTVTISGGTDDATYTATVSSGKVTALTQVFAGTTYTSTTNATTTGGTGTGLNVSIVRIADSANTLTQTIATSSSNPITSYTLPQASGNITWTGTPYRVAFTIAGYSGSGWIKLTLGQTSAYYQSNGTYNLMLISSSTALTFTPTGDFVGQVTNASAKSITSLPALAAFDNNDGSAGLEIRSGGAEKWNTFVGAGAGENYTSNLVVDEGFNTAVGNLSMYSNTSGSNNTALGFYSLFSNTTAYNNVAVGSDALYANTTGDSNTAVGFYALQTNTTGTQNIALGGETLYYNTTGNYNTASGYAAMFVNSTGSSNTATGYAALFSNKTGGGNTAAGYQALYDNTTGGQNAATGDASLTSNTTGAGNTASGYNSMRQNTTGSSNAAFGYDSLYNATSSSNNTAVGDQAMLGSGSALTGIDDVGLGYKALQQYTTGSDDTALGYEAMLNATTSANSTAVGYLAGRGTSNNDSYTGLSALGYQTGYNLANNGNYNTLIGYQAGYNVTTGADNILIGSATSSNANANLTTGSQNILIGENDKLPSATANGQLDIGNEIYGVNISGTGSTVSSGDIGIGQASPGSLLSVNGGGSFGSTYSTLAAPTNGLIVSGNTGIGTSTPYSRLTVWGPDTASSTLAFNVVTSASTTVFAVFDGGNAELSGTLTQNSDERLKTNIQSLDASSSLSLIDQLNPVTFNWIDPDEGTTPQLGFIAQQVQQIFPNLVSNTSATALTPGGTLGLNYIGLIAPAVSAIQEIAAISGEFESNLIAWLGNASNGITDLFAENGHFSNELCVGSTCVISRPRNFRPWWPPTTPHKPPAATNPPPRLNRAPRQGQTLQYP